MRITIGDKDRTWITISEEGCAKLSLEQISTIVGCASVPEGEARIEHGPITSGNCPDYKLPDFDKLKGPCPVCGEAVCGCGI